jgi:hypothetical protein
MRAGGGKQKGASFEREVCVQLSGWISNGTREDVFWRSAMSGGRATVGHKRGKNHSTQVGDISCIHPIGNRFIEAFAPECKHYADLNYQGLLTGNGKLLTFWDEISKQAERYGKQPFLIARQNRMPTVICVGKAGIHLLHLSYDDAVLISPMHDMYIIKFDHFLKVCKPYVAFNRRPALHRPRKRLLPV